MAKPNGTPMTRMQALIVWRLNAERCALPFSALQKVHVRRRQAQQECTPRILFLSPSGRNLSIAFCMSSLSASYCSSSAAASTMPVSVAVRRPCDSLLCLVLPSPP